MRSFTTDELDRFLQIDNLLEDEQPLVIKPKLAKLIGLNEAIVLQQIKYWIKKSRHEYGGTKWVYNSYQEWQKQFPFWSVSTIKRIFLSLESQGLIISGNFNKEQRDRTKWYTLSWGENLPLGQIDPMEGTIMTPPLPENTPRENNYSSEMLEQIKKVYDYWLKLMVIDPTTRTYGTLNEKRAALDRARKRTRLTDKRKTKVAARIKSMGADRVIQAVKQISKSEFHRDGILSNGSKGTFVASLEWLCENDERVENWANKGDDQ